MLASINIQFINAILPFLYNMCHVVIGAVAYVTHNDSFTAVFGFKTVRHGTKCPVFIFAMYGLQEDILIQICLQVIQGLCMYTGKQFVAFIAGIIRNEIKISSAKMLAESTRTDRYIVPAIIKEEQCFRKFRKLYIKAHSLSYFQL